jgi:hypothetical protein
MSGQSIQKLYILRRSLHRVGTPRVLLYRTVGLRAEWNVHNWKNELGARRRDGGLFCFTKIIRAFITIAIVLVTPFLRTWKSRTRIVFDSLSRGREYRRIQSSWELYKQQRRDSLTRWRRRWFSQPNFTKGGGYTLRQTRRRFSRRRGTYTWWKRLSVTTKYT